MWKKFNEYVDQTMHRISKENKLIFLMGDFNVNLLKYNSHETNHFVNTMILYCLLPHILHPACHLVSLITLPQLVIISSLAIHHMKQLVKIS